MAVVALAGVIGIAASATAADSVNRRAPAPTGSITVTVTSPQQLDPIDPARVRLDAAVKTTLDCSAGCTLVHWLYTDAHVGGYVYAKAATCTFPGGTVHTCTGTYTDSQFADAFSGPSGFALCRQWLGPDDGCRGGLFPVTATPTVEPDSVISVGTGWQRDVDLSATETMILRTSVLGARVERKAATYAATVAIVSQTGPKAGVLRAVVNGSTVLTVDLRRATQSVRQIVGNVSVPKGATLALENATPAGRTAKEVTVDALLPLVKYPGTGPFRGRPSPSAPGARPASPPSRGAAPKASITARPSLGQTLPADLKTVDLDVIAKVPGCPKVCRITSEGWDHDPVTLLTKKSPASATLQTLQVTHRAKPDYADEPKYVLYLSPQDTYGTAWADGNPVRDEQNWSADDGYGFTYSHGWVLDTNGTVTRGTIERSSTPQTGATYRAMGFQLGRQLGLVAARGPQGGVMKVYNDGVLVSTIDLYAAKWQPRLVVAVTSLKLHGRLTVINASPASRPGKDIHVDAVVTLGATFDSPERH